MLVDTHCHLHFEQFDVDRDDVIARAKSAGIVRIVNVGTDPLTNQAAYDLSKQYPFMASSAGLHPHHAHEVDDKALEGVARFVKEAKPVAIGEIGLDYFKSEADPAIQKKVFVRMLGIARDNHLPVIIHSRNALKDTLNILRAEAKGRLHGVMHCYSYDLDGLKEIMDIGFFVSFTANITFKNAGALLSVACQVPLDRIMLETDAPYLAPQSHRGKRNEPSFLAQTAEFLAEKRSVDLVELKRQTTKNAISFFDLPGIDA